MLSFHLVSSFFQIDAQLLYVSRNSVFKAAEGISADTGLARAIHALLDFVKAEFADV